MKKLNDYIVKTNATEFDIQRVWDENTGSDFVVIDSDIPFYSAGWHSAKNQFVLVSESIIDQIQLFLTEEEIASAMPDGKVFEVFLNCYQYHIDKEQYYLSMCDQDNIEGLNMTALRGFLVFKWDEDSFIDLYTLFKQKQNKKYSYEIQAFKFD